MTEAQTEAYWAIEKRPTRANATYKSLCARRLARILASLACLDESWQERPWKIHSKRSLGRSRRPIIIVPSGAVHLYFSMSDDEELVVVAHSRSKRIGADWIDQASEQECESYLMDRYSWRSLVVLAMKEAAFRASSHRAFRPQAIQIENLASNLMLGVGSLSLDLHCDFFPSGIVTRASRPGWKWKRITI
jgi:hypothetical protein